jgi:hypothetical protein
MSQTATPLSYRLPDGTVARFEGLYYVGGKGHVPFYATADGRTLSEEQIERIRREAERKTRQEAA